MKLHLTIDSGTIAGQSFDLETGFLSIGRSETCSVRFDPISERIASKQHAFIEAKADGFYLTDNKSTNGTLVNGVRVDSARLNSGDQIQFGVNGATATVRIDETAAVPSAPGQQGFREFEAQQFDQAAAQQPVSVSMSLQSFGLGNVAVKPEPPKTGRYIGIAVTIFAIVFLSLIVVLLMFASVGIFTAIIAAVVAFVPSMLYILPLMWLDRYDPEPAWLLALAFAWGALVAVIVSFVVNTVFSVAVYVGTRSEGLSSVAGAVISAPLIEEGSKGVGLLILLIFFRRYFDDILDGIVFGGVIALGFATVENVLYYGNGLNTAVDTYGITVKALMSFLVLFALRGIFSPFAHATFTSMTGIGCGIARESHNGFVRFIMPVLGYGLAVTLHATWNGMGIVAMILLRGFGIEGVCQAVGLGGENIGLCSFFSAYFVLEVPLFFIFVIFALLIMRRQRKILTEMLAIDIARGLIPEEDAKTATSAFKSSKWILGGLFKGKFRARNRYVRAIGKLGLSYWHIQRATAAQGQTGSFQQNPILRDEVLKWRDQV